jgi:DNA polymerase (family 10)
MRYGVGIARKGWLSAGDVLNTYSAEDVEAFFQKRRSK